MTKFENGPAHGITLMIHRTPFLLRVTRRGEKFDALDQPKDEPEMDEELYAYRCKDITGHIHINTGRKPGGGFYPMAVYEYVDPQPSDKVMRFGWTEWCETPEHVAEYEAAHKRFTDQQILKPHA